MQDLVGSFMDGECGVKVYIQFLLSAKIDGVKLGYRKFLKSVYEMLSGALVCHMSA